MTLIPVAPTTPVQAQMKNHKAILRPTKPRKENDQRRKRSWKNRIKLLRGRRKRKQRKRQKKRQPITGKSLENRVIARKMFLFCFVRFYVICNYSNNVFWLINFWKAVKPVGRKYLWQTTLTTWYPVRFTVHEATRRTTRHTVVNWGLN